MGKLKQTLASIVLAGALALGAGSKADADLIFHEDFESYAQSSDIYRQDGDFLLRGGSVSNQQALSQTQSARIDSLNTWQSLGLSNPSNLSFESIQWISHVNYSSQSELYLTDDFNINSQDPHNYFFGLTSFIANDQFIVNESAIMNTQPNRWYQITKSVDLKLNTETVSILDELSGNSESVSGLLSSSYFPNSSGSRGYNSEIYFSGIPQEVFIDDLSINATPEPATLGMLGLGALGLATIRRRNESKK